MLALPRQDVPGNSRWGLRQCSDYGGLRLVAFLISKDDRVTSELVGLSSAKSRIKSALDVNETAAEKGEVEDGLIGCTEKKVRPDLVKEERIL